jgi:hypothetical protein
MLPACAVSGHSYLVPAQADPLLLCLSGCDGPHGQQRRGYGSRIKPQLSVSHVTIWQLGIISDARGFQQCPCPLTPTLISSELKLVDGVKMWFLVSALTSAICSSTVRLLTSSVPWLRRVITGLPPWGHGFDIWPGLVEFVRDKLALA